MEEEKIQQFASDFFRVEEEIGSVIIGQKELVRNVLTAMVAGGNVLLEGMESAKAFCCSPHTSHDSFLSIQNPSMNSISSPRYLILTKHDYKHIR